MRGAGWSNWPELQARCAEDALWQWTSRADEPHLLARELGNEPRQDRNPGSAAPSKASRSPVPSPGGLSGGLNRLRKTGRSCRSPRPWKLRPAPGPSDAPAWIQKATGVSNDKSGRPPEGVAPPKPNTCQLPPMNRLTPRMIPCKEPPFRRCPGGNSARRSCFSQSARFLHSSLEKVRPQRQPDSRGPRPARKKGLADRNVFCNSISWASRSWKPPPEVRSAVGLRSDDRLEIHGESKAMGIGISGP